LNPISTGISRQFNDSMDALSAIAQFWLAPVLALLVSVAYFRASPGAQPLGQRLAVSSHGAVIAGLYFTAMLISAFGMARPSFDRPFTVALALPLMFMAFSLVKFQGRACIHALQVVNLLALFWAFFVGSMAVTGNWL